MERRRTERGESKAYERRMHSAAEGVGSQGIARYQSGSRRLLSDVENEAEVKSHRMKQESSQLGKENVLVNA